MQTVRLHGLLICRDPQEAAIVAAHLPQHIELTRAEPGCISFAVDATEDLLVWTVDEEFEDAASFRAHQARVRDSVWGRATERIEREYTFDGL
ncbi:putative quinol monooxygenase [Brachybacterium nesterenkovii]|uniref:putative quinol monooxygenase n=1 Tax=Brachybacterium nesterenkovii TaxID=47847 RepID=UPI00321908C3